MTPTGRTTQTRTAGSGVVDGVVSTYTMQTFDVTEPFVATTRVTPRLTAVTRHLYGVRAVTDAIPGSADENVTGASSKTLPDESRTVAVRSA